jgi:hypothetical protein
MCNIDTITISEFLLKYSSVLADKPFRFLSKEQIARDGEIARKNPVVPSVNDATASNPRVPSGNNQHFSERSDISVVHHCGFPERYA